MSANKVRPCEFRCAKLIPVSPQGAHQCAPQSNQVPRINPGAINGAPTEPDVGGALMRPSVKSGTAHKPGRHKWRPYGARRRGRINAPLSQIRYRT